MDMKPCSPDAKAVTFHRTSPTALLGSAAAHPDDAVQVAQLANVRVGEGARARALACHQESGCIQLCHKPGHGLGILRQEVSAGAHQHLHLQRSHGQVVPGKGMGIGRLLAICTHKDAQLPEESMTSSASLTGALRYNPDQDTSGEKHVDIKAFGHFAASECTSTQGGQAQLQTKSSCRYIYALMWKANIM